MKRYKVSRKSIFRLKKVAKVVKTCCKNLDSTDPREKGQSHTNTQVTHTKKNYNYTFTQKQNNSTTLSTLPLIFSFHDWNSPNHDVQNYPHENSSFEKTVKISTLRSYYYSCYVHEHYSYSYFYASQLPCLSYSLLSYSALLLCNYKTFSP